MNKPGSGESRTAAPPVSDEALALDERLHEVRRLFHADAWNDAASIGRRLLGQAFGLVQTNRPAGHPEGDPRQPFVVADVATWLVRIARRQEQFDDALRWADIALTAALAIADPGRECLARAQTARVLSTLCQTEDALEQSYAALRAATVAGTPRFEAAALDALADVQWSMAQWDDALRSYARMLELAQACDDIELQAIAHGGLGGIHHHLGEASSSADEAAAAAHFRRAANEALHYLRCAESLGDGYNIRTATHNHAVAMLGLGDTAGARAALEALLARAGMGDSAMRALTLKNLGDVALTEGRVGDAIALGHQALTASERLHQPQNAMVCCAALSLACEAAGDLAAALGYHRRFHDLYVEVASESAQARSRAMAVKYDTDKAHALAAAQRARADRLESSHSSLSVEAERLMRMSLEDPLTGIGNRRRLEQALSAAGGAADAARCCSLAMLDIDNFKRVNDDCSHVIGDAVLRRIGAILAANARRDDIPARYGGEEFALILDGLDRQTACQVCERIRHAVEAEDWRALHPSLHVTISIGLAHRDLRAAGGPTAIPALLELADWRLYAAKRGGRNQVVDEGGPAVGWPTAPPQARRELLPFRPTGT